MATFEDPAKKVGEQAVPEHLATVPAPAPVPMPVVPAATAGATQTQAANPADVAAVFPHMTDAAPAAIPGLTPHKVKTQAIKTDSGPMLDDLVQASGLSKAERSTARSTANHLLEESVNAGVINMNQYAYELATTRRESHMGNWMNEFGGNAYFEKKYGMHSSHRDDLQNTQPGDGAAFHGRGLVQVTGRRNYTDWTNRLAQENFKHDGQAVDLVNHPELAADPQIAAHIAVKGMRDGTFTGRKLSDYVNDDKTDFYNARRVINGTDEATEIANQATAFQGVLKHHAGDYANAVNAIQMKNLPSAHSGELGGNPSALTPAMLDHHPMGSGTSKFVSPEKLLKNSVGRFDHSVPLGKYTTVKTHAAE